MDLLLYIAMGVFAVLFAVVLYYLVIWAVGRASRPNRPVPPAGTTADRQPGDDQPRPNSTTGRKS